MSLGSFSQSIGAFRITGGTVSGTGTLASNADYDVQAGTVNVILGGSAGLNKSSPGAATLGGNNSYTGPTVISEGALVLSGAGQIGISSPITNDAWLSFEGDAMHTVGTIDGLGATQVIGDTILTATSIAQDTLSIGIDLMPEPPPVAAAGGSSAAPVPEPNTLVLLALAGLGIVLAVRRRE